MAENLQTIMQNRMDEKRAADLEAQANRENQISKLDTDQAAARDRTVGEGVYPSTTVPAEPVDKFPALEPSGGKGVFKSPAPELIEEYGEELAPVPIVDFAIKKNVKAKVKDPSLIKTNVFIQDVDNLIGSSGETIPFSLDTAEAKAAFANSQGVYNSKGQYLPFSQLPDNYMSRINAANNFGAVSIVSEGGTQVDFDWDGYLLKETTVPDFELTIAKQEDSTDEFAKQLRVFSTSDITRSRVKWSDLTTEEKETWVNKNSLISLSMLDQEQAFPVYAQILKKRLNSVGVTDPRTILGVVKHAQNSISMGDFEKIQKSAVEGNVRFPIQMLLWGAGEVTDSVLSVFNLAMAESSDESGYWDIRSSVRRQSILSDAWPEATDMFIATMAQKGFEISLPAAEEYMNTFTGAGPRILNIASQVLPFSRALVIKAGLTNKKELQLFDAFFAKELSEGTSRSVEESLKKFVSLRPQIRFNKKTGLIEETDDQIDPSIFQRIRFGPLRTQVKLNRAMQSRDASNPVLQRAEVIAQKKYMDRLKNRQKGAETRIANGTGTIKDRQLLKAIKKDLSEATTELQAIEVRSATPLWIRDVKRTDSAIVLGMGLTGHMFQMTDSQDGSVMNSTYMGELIGLGGGIMFDVLRTVSNPAYFRVMGSDVGKLLFKSVPGAGGKDRYRKFLAKHISKYSPEMQATMQARGDYVSNAFEPLIKAGLDEGTISMSVANLSNLVGLQGLEDITRATMSVGAMATDQKSLEVLQTVVMAKTRTIEALRGVLFNLQAPDPSAPKVAQYDEFYGMIAEAVTGGQASVDELTELIGIINTDGVTSQLDKLRQNLSFVEAQSLGGRSKQTVDIAVRNLQDQNLLTSSGLPKAEFEMLANKVVDEVAKVVNKVSKNVIKELGNLDSAKIKIKDFSDTQYPGGILAQGASQPVLISSIESTGELLATILEASHGSQKAIAQQAYYRLGTPSKPAKFFLEDGSPVTSGMATVNIGDAFDALFTVQEAGVIKSRQLAKSGMSKGQRSANEAIFEELAEPFFLALADEGDSVEDVVKGLVKSFKNSGKLFNKEESQTVQVIRYLREAANSSDTPEATMLNSMLNVSLNQMREFDRAVTELSYKIDGEDAKTLKTVSAILSSKMGQFSIETADGSVLPAQTLFIKDTDGMLESVPDVLNKANQGWGEYKNKWHDKGSVIPKWMSWGKRDTSSEVATNVPLNITYRNGDPKTWLNIRSLVNMDSQTEGKAFYNNLARVLGTKVQGSDPDPSVVTYAFIEGETTTEAFRSILSAAVSEHIVGQKSSLIPGQAFKELDNLSRIFTMKSADGTDVPMISVGKVLDDVQAFNAKSIGQATYDDVVKTAEKDLEVAIGGAIKPAVQRLESKKLAVKFLESYTGKKLSNEAIAGAITDSGSLVVQELRQELKNNTKLTDDQISGVLANVYLDSMMSKVFPNGRKMNITDVDTLSQEFAVNLDVLNEMLGLNNTTKQGIVKELIGDERFTVWESAAKVITELDASTVAKTAIQGVPRALSVESYVSRIYAWQRNAIGLRWLASESMIQQSRIRRYNMLKGAMLDPEFGTLFLEMIRTGKPFSPEKETLFLRAFTNSLAASSSDAALLLEERKLKDEIGRDIVVNPGGVSNVELSKGVGSFVKSLIPKRKRDINTVKTPFK